MFNQIKNKNIIITLSSANNEFITSSLITLPFTKGQVLELLKEVSYIPIQNELISIILSNKNELVKELNISINLTSFINQDKKEAFLVVKATEINVLACISLEDGTEDIKYYDKKITRAYIEKDLTKKYGYKKIFGGIYE